MAYSSVDQMSNLGPSYWNKNGWTEKRCRDARDKTALKIRLLLECQSSLVVQDILRFRQQRMIFEMALDSHLLRNPPKRVSGGLVDP